MALLEDAQKMTPQIPGGPSRPPGPLGGPVNNGPDGGISMPSSEPGPPVDPFGTSLEDLYGGEEVPMATGPGVPSVPTPGGAGVTGTDRSAAEVGTPGAAAAETGAIGSPSQAQADTDLISQAEGLSPEQTALTPEQQADAELARITGQDSSLMARARAEAAQYANRRGLQNTSMAAGATMGAMVDRATPLALQNAALGAQRERENTMLRQEAGMFTSAEQNRLNALSAELGTSVSTFNASEQNRLAALEAELGTSVSVFNAEQLNQAESLAAQMRTALESQDAEAYNRASMQLADLQRNAQAQQADISFAAEQQRVAEQQAYNQQVIDRVSTLNEQYLRGSQAMDLATIQGTYNQIISTNQTAGQLYQSYFNGIAGVMDNPDMTPSQIASAVDNMQRMLEASLRMVAEMNAMDFGDITGTIPGGAPPAPRPGPGGPNLPTPPPSVPPRVPGTPGYTPPSPGGEIPDTDEFYRDYR